MKTLPHSRIEVKGRDYPKHMSTEILVRAIGEKGFVTLAAQYEDSKLIPGGRSRVCTQHDLMMLSEFKKGIPISKLKRKHNVSHAAIQTSIRIAALEKLKHED